MRWFFLCGIKRRWRVRHLARQILIDRLFVQFANFGGQAFVPDTEVRWNAIVEVAQAMGLPLCEKLVTQIADNSPSPHLGYKATQKLLATGEAFTALFAFNDICAMGAIRALHEFGLRVPEDVSVLGFDEHRKRCLPDSRSHHGTAALEGNGKDRGRKCPRSDLAAHQEV